jgi:hypothetical protein
MHGTIIKKQAMVVANAPPAMPRNGTIYQLRTPVTIAPPIRIYIGILGFPIPWMTLVEMVKNHYKDYLRVAVIAYDDEAHFYENCGFKMSEDASPMFITSLWT